MNYALQILCYCLYRPLIVIAAAFMLAASPVGAPCAPAAAPTAIAAGRARMVIEKMEMDAGDITRGDDANFTFNIKNTGDMPLEIDAAPACGCTVAQYDHAVLPGATGTLHAAVHTGSYHGPIRKVIDITSNDPDQPHVTLALLANVLSALEVLPGDTPMVNLKDAGPTMLDLQLQSRGKAPVQITRVTTSAAYAKADLQPAATTPGGGHSYKLTLTIGPEAPVGRTVILVTATTDSPQEPEVTITAVCDKGIRVVPPSIYFGAIDSKTPLPLVQLISLIKHEGPFHITKMQTNDPHLKVIQRSVQDGLQYQLALSYTGGWAAGTVQHKLTILTDDPKQPRFDLPVLASVLPGQ